MAFDSTHKLDTAPPGAKNLPWRRLAVKLVPYEPELPPRPAVAESDSQCDCACFAIESMELPCLSTPVSFYLELTPFCHNHCSGCGNAFAGQVPYERDKKRPLPISSPPLTAKDWVQILDKIRPQAYRLKLTGGEPTLHPEFETIIEQVASRDIPFTLFSNGRWPVPERIIDLLKDIPSFEGLLISLHGPTQASHEAFTQTPDSFTQTLSNVWMATTAGLEVSLSCIITDHNWHLMDRMLDLARQIGIKSLIWNRYLGREIDGLTVSPAQLRAAVRWVGEMRAEGKPVKMGNCLPLCFTPTDQAGCLAGQAFLTIDPWGRARPCNHALLLCGNLLHQSVEEIWYSPGMDRWRKAYPAQCDDCAAFATCRGGCRAQALILNRQADPLIGTPLPLTTDRPVDELTFYAHARPVGRFVQRAESFGTLLISGNRIFPVDHDGQNTLALLDGHSTLQEIEATCGPSGLALVASLYQQGMVELL